MTPEQQITNATAAGWHHINPIELTGFPSGQRPGDPGASPSPLPTTPAEDDDLSDIPLGTCQISENCACESCQ